MNYTTQSTFDRKLHSRMKMQYYPTDVGEMEKLSKLFDFGDTDFTVLEPCIGNAKAVKTFLSRDGEVVSNAHIFGVELDAKRYLEHIKDDEQIPYAINGDFLNIKASRRSFSLVFCNPPYDEDIVERGKRVENDFLRKITEYVAYGGYLVWIVPVHLLRDYEYSRKAFAKRYQVVDIYRFSDPVYEQFSQVVLIGKLRSEHSSIDSDEERIEAAMRNLDELKTLNDIKDSSISVRAIDPNEIKVFQGTHLDEDAAIEKLASSPLYKVMNNAVKVDAFGINVGRPPLMPNADQLFTMIAVGRAPIKKVGGNILQRGVVKEYVSEEEFEKNGKAKIRTTMFSKPTLTLIEKNGNITRLER